LAGPAPEQNETGAPVGAPSTRYRTLVAYTFESARLASEGFEKLIAEPRGTAITGELAVSIA